MIQIIADTTSCLPAEVQQQYQIPVIPQLIHFGEKSYIEGQEIGTESFLDQLERSAVLPKTSAPPPEFFKDQFQKHASSAETIICIHPSADLSGNVRSAETARIEFPDLDIRVLDTRLVASPLGTVVQQAAAWANEGLDPDTICQRVRELSDRGQIYFLVSTLDYLARGGRIGNASALLGNALRIKPILSLVNGQVEPLSKERTFKKALTSLKNLVLDDYPPDQPGYLSIMHAGTPDLADDLAVFFQERLQIPQPHISYLPPAIITHAGPGSIAAGFFQ